MKRLPLISSFGSTPRRKLYIAIAAQMIASASAQAAPAGGTIVGGSGVIEQLGADTTIIQNTDRLAIDWDTFNIGAEERVQFIQPDADSIALNRILGNEASQIFGRLDANGHVILMNPNGVLFGESATVNVGGLVAAGLNINADDFINGEMVFQALEGKDGAVINQGIINAATGGNVALIGKQVDNQGLISAKLGSVTLAAGKEAVLTFDNQGLIGVRVSKEILQSELGVDAAVSNSGEITAEGGRVLLTGSASQDIFSQAVNADGLNAKTSVVMHEDGSFTLGAGADVVNTGTISTSSTTAEAGDIVVLGENVNSSGTILANSKTAAGDIEIHSRDTTLLTENSTTSAINDGAGSGGQIKILGDRVGVLDQSQIHTSGTHGGGDIHIGGGFQGKETQLRNASRTAIGKDTLIEANATAQGDGGEVIVWADETTSFTGEINVRGGELGGDGGFVEVSGKENLRFLGSVDRTAVRGENGTLLLDPEDIGITPGADPSADDIELSDQQILFSDGVGTFTISGTAISQALEQGDVILQARNSIRGGHIVDVRVSDASNPNSLIMEAGNFMDFGGPTTYFRVQLGTGDIIFNSGTLQADGAMLSGYLGLETDGNVYLRSAGALSLAAPSIQAGGSVLLSGGQYVGIQRGRGPAQGVIEGDLFISTGSLTQNERILLPSGSEYDLPVLALAEPTAEHYGQIEFDEYSVVGPNGHSFYVGGQTKIESASSIDLRFLYIGDIEGSELTDINITAVDDVVLGQISTGGGLAVRSSRDIYAEQNISTSGGSIELTGANINFGESVVIDTTGVAGQGDVFFESGGDINLGHIFSGGNLEVRSTGGEINAESAIDIEGDALFDAATRINLTQDFSILSDGDIKFSAAHISSPLFTGNPVVSTSGSLSYETSGQHLVLGGVYKADSLSVKTNGGIFYVGTGEVQVNKDIVIDLGEGRFEGQTGYMVFDSGSFSALGRELWMSDVVINTDVNKGTGDISLISSGSRFGGSDISLPSINPEGSHTTGDFFVQAPGDVVAEPTVISKVLPHSDLSGSARFEVGGNLYLPEIAATNAQGQRDISINVGGFLIQSYDVRTGGGSYTATAEAFQFGDNVEINTEIDNPILDGAVGGNITLNSATDLALPSIRTRSDCLDTSSCGTLNVVAASVINKGDVHVFGDASFDVIGSLSLNVSALMSDIETIEDIEDIEAITVESRFGGSLSVNAAYARIGLAESVTLGEWNLDSTDVGSFIVIHGENSIIGNDVLSIEGGFILAADYISLRNTSSRFDSLNIIAGHADVVYSGDITIGGYLYSDKSTFTVDGNLTVSQLSGEYNSDLSIFERAAASGVVLDVSGNIEILGENNRLSSIKILNAQDVEVFNNGTLTLDGINAESLSLDILGDINQTDVLNITGETSILASGGTSIDLSNPLNDFNTLSVQAEGPATINIADANSIHLADIGLNGAGQGGDVSISASVITQEENSYILLQDAARLNMQADYITLGADGSASVDIYDSVLNAVFDKDFKIQGVIQGAEDSGNSGLAGLYINGSAEENLFEVADGGSIIGEFREGSKVALGDGDDIIHFAGDVVLAVEGGAGDDRFTIASPSISVANIIGNAGFDTLIGSDADTNWTLAEEGLGTFTTEEAFGQFNGIERIEGGSGADQFIIDGAEVSVELIGGEGVDRLVANPSNAAINNQWVIDGDNSGSLNEFVVFSSVENLVGNDGTDQVIFAEGAQIGEIRTGLGDDVVTLAANVAATLLDAGDGEDTLNLNGIDSIYTYLNVLIGGDADYTAVNFEVENNDGGSKTIVGVDGYNAEWIIDGDGSVFISATQGGVTETNRFAGVTRLEGASGDDTFILQGGNIDHIVGGQGGVDTIQASNAENFWQLHADGGYLNEISFAEIEILNGGSGIDEFILTSSTTSVTQINGGDGVSSLIAFDQENLWDINSIGSSLNSTLKFDSIANLVGGSAADSFVINSGGYSLVIDGGNGANQLSVKTNQDLQWEINSNDIQLSAPQIRLNVLLTNIQTLDIDLSESNFYINDLDNPLDEIKGGRLALHTFDFSRIEGALTLNLSSLPFGIADFNYSQIIGNGQQTEIVGDAVNTAWLIHDGFVEAITDLTWSPGFVNVGKIQGGSANDEFQVLTLSNAIEVDGGAGVNRLIAGASQNTVNINAAYSGTLNDNVIFSGIQEIDGGSGNDTFTFSPNSSIGNINAGAGDDTFILANNVTTGILDGGDGNDTLDRDSLNFVVTYLNELLEGDAVYTAANIETETFIGGSTTVVGAEGYDAQWTISGEGTLSVTATGSDGTIVTNQFAGVTRAEGGSGTDEFILLEGGALADGIFGNGGDSLQASDTTNTWKINSEDGGELAVGGSTLLFQGIANLIGGSGSDVFDIVTGGSITGSIDGGAGVDTLMISDASATNSWQLGAVNSVAQVARFQRIETITGNSGDDTFAFTGISDVTAIEGGEGNNRLLWNAGDLAVNLSTGLLNEEIQFSGISSFDADAAASNTLTGADAVNSWLVDGDAAGTVSNANGSVAFSGFQTLIGGAEADTFTLAAGVNIGEIYGGAGNDLFVIGEGVIADNLYGEEGDDSFEVGLGLTLSGVLDGGSGGETNGDTIDLSQFTLLDATEELESVVGFAFRNFERIEQPNNAGVYFGGHGTNFWYITGANEGRLEIRDGEKAGVYEFSGVHSVLGGEGEDIFIFANDAAAVSTLIDGGEGAGANTLDLSAQGLINQWLIDGTNSGSVSNSSNTAGNVFTNIAYLIGGSSQDIFELHAGGSIAGAIDGGLGADELRVAMAQTSQWQLGGAGGHSVTGVASFTNIESLIGGAGADNFDVLAPLADVTQLSGGMGSDAVNFLYDAPVGVDLARGLADGLLVEEVERFTAIDAGSTLTGADVVTTWVVDGADRGSIRYQIADGDGIDVAFAGFGNLHGGGADDQFLFTQGGSVSGTLNGGGGHNRVDLQALAGDLHVAAAPEIAIADGLEQLTLMDVDQLIGNGRTWLYGASDRSYTWIIDGARSGRMTSTSVDDDNRLLAFENLSAIRGGAHDDIFQVMTASPLLSLDGGDSVTADLVDYSQVNGNLSINLTEALSGQNGAISGVEGIRGNNAGPNSLHQAELVGPDSGAVWTIGGLSNNALADNINDGSVTFGEQTVTFIDFNLLTGGAGTDIFNQMNGIVLGALNGGAGNDTFNIDLVGANAGTTIIGGAGVDSLTLRGGDADGLMTYTAAADGGKFDYSSAGVHYTLSHQGVENVRDNSLAASLDIGGSSAAETFTLANNRFWINGGDVIEYSNKRDLAVHSGINDIIEIADNLVVENTLTLANGTVIANDPANNSITAATLILDSVRDVGLASARLRTSVDDLLVRNSAGDIYLQEQNGLNLAEFSANRLFDLHLLNGDLTNSAPLLAADVFRVVANNGNVTLTGANQLRDDVAVTGDRVEIHNASTLTLIDINAGELVLRTQRGIEGDGPIRVSGLTDIDAQGDVLLDFTANDFNRVRVTNAVNLTLVDENAIELLDINASGKVVVRSTNAITLNDTVTGGNGVEVSSGMGSINQNGDISTNSGSVVVSAGNGEVNLDEDARIVSNGGSVNINAGAGNVNMGSDTRITANGGDVNIEAADSVVVAEVVSSGQVTISAGNGGVSDGNGGATNITAGGLEVTSNTGVGNDDGLETSVGNIDITTKTGNVAVSNTGDVTVGKVSTEQGDISLVNQGNVELGGGSIVAENGTGGGSVNIDVNQGSVSQSGSTNIPAVKSGGVVVINAPDGAIGEGGGLRVDAPFVEIVAAIKAGDIFVNPGADKIEYFSGSFKFDDQLLAVEPLDDINPAIFANVKSYSFNEISVLLPRDQLYDEDDDQ